jgi:hypothetical protein
MKPLWFETRVDSVCDCACDIDIGDLAAWLPDDEDGAIVCLTCGEDAETTSGKEASYDRSTACPEAAVAAAAGLR